ncbi:hypothetical protein HD806DRAFT_533376 [Xylariaceae sp. AK1471]|nr:hypothetical protein HD806DRAFT_533376 [Xylariaceae sp. AK1471]
MSTPSTPKRRRFRTYQDVPDMSTDGGKFGKIVTIRVGPNLRPFQVHLARLGPLDKLFDEASGKEVAELPDEDPDVFNLLVNWAYNEPLPRASQTPEYTNKASSLEPDTPNTPSPVDSEQGNSLPAKRKLEEIEPQTPTKSRSFNLAHLKEAHKTQNILLGLMVMAERHGWEKLYNAAIDAFREGEANLDRNRPSLAHIEEVYEKTSSESSIRQFFGDYAYSLGKANRDISWYLQEKFFQKIPDFLEDMLKRVDGKGPFKYPFWCRNGKEVFTQEAPLELSTTTYHIHDGRLELYCPRSRDGCCASK